MRALLLSSAFWTAYTVMHIIFDKCTKMIWLSKGERPWGFDNKFARIMREYLSVMSANVSAFRL